LTHGENFDAGRLLTITMNQGKCYTPPEMLNGGQVPKYAYPIQDFKFLVEDAAERNIVLESSECRDVDTFQTAEGVLQQLSQMVVQANPGDVLLFVFSGHAGVNRHGVGFMDLGRADATQEESRTIKGNDLLLIILINFFSLNRRTRTYSYKPLFEIVQWCNDVCT
jgi:hypothetical protein